MIRENWNTPEGMASEDPPIDAETAAEGRTVDVGVNTHRQPPSIEGTGARSITPDAGGTRARSKKPDAGGTGARTAAEGRTVDVGVNTDRQPPSIGGTAARGKNPDARGTRARNKKAAGRKAAKQPPDAGRTGGGPGTQTEPSGLAPWAKVALGATVGATAVVTGIPLVVSALGFGAGGISAGSMAATLMSLAARAGVGGGLVGLGQSIGAVGLSATGTAVGATVGGVAGGAVAAAASGGPTGEGRQTKHVATNTESDDDDDDDDEEEEEHKIYYYSGELDDE